MDESSGEEMLDIEDALKLSERGGGGGGGLGAVSLKPSISRLANSPMRRSILGSSDLDRRGRE